MCKVLKGAERTFLGRSQGGEQTRGRESEGGLGGSPRGTRALEAWGAGGMGGLVGSD